jgi:hypothetical protein
VKHEEENSTYWGKHSGSNDGSGWLCSYGGTNTNTNANTYAYANTRTRTNTGTRTNTATA